jgi:hypothetical protein
MNRLLFVNEYRDKNQFRIDYPYYGLFGSADITTTGDQNELIYECRLLNGTILCLKKLLGVNRWIDKSCNEETPLSATIGNAIDDFLKNSNSNVKE